MEAARRQRLEEALRRCLNDRELLAFQPPSDPEAWLGARLVILDRLSADAVLPGEERFPAGLIGIPDEPTHLFHLGRLPAGGAFSVAVVGTREPTPTGRRFAAEAGRALAAAGATVVSGLARGIDSVAHAAALEAESGAAVPTVAILASGLDRIYPPENAGLFRRIVERGAVVTEFPPGVAALKHHFLRRNRLLSGMACLTVVVEARRKSGALVTAHYAMEQGREVGAVPGDVFSPQSEGTNRLIADGAMPLTSVEALVEQVRHLGLPRPRGPRSRRKSPPEVPRGSEAEAVMDRLGPRPQAVDVIARDTGFDPEKVWSILLELELGGLVRRFPGGYVRWQ